MNDNDFNLLVNADIREDASRDDKAWLRQPENLDRWIAELTKIKMNVEKQLAGARYDRARARATMDDDELREWQADHEKWRAGVIRFKTGVDKKLVEVKNQRVNTIERYRLAIERHCDTIGTEGGEADEELWSILEG